VGFQNAFHMRPSLGAKAIILLNVVLMAVESEYSRHTVAALIIEPLRSIIYGERPEIALRFLAYFSHK
jgi:hypothetical protein